MRRKRKKHHSTYILHIVNLYSFVQNVIFYPQRHHTCGVCSFQSSQVGHRHCHRASVSVSMKEEQTEKPNGDQAQLGFSDDENAHNCATPKPKAKASSRGGKPNAKAKSKGKELETGGRRAPVTSCICPGCPWPEYTGSRFCAEGDHKKAWDNMVYQRRSRKDISEEDKTKFDESMKDDGFAGKTVLEFSRDNPPEMKKKGFVDFTRFERVESQRIGNKSSAGDVPMTGREKAFHKHCENVLGLEVDETQDLWKEYYSDKTIARDNKGFRGPERFWLPLHEMQSREREHYVDNRVVEGSGDIKAPSMTDRKILED